MRNLSPHFLVLACLAGALNVHGAIIQDIPPTTVLTRQLLTNKLADGARVTLGVTAGAYTYDTVTFAAPGDKLTLIDGALATNLTLEGSTTGPKIAAKMADTTNALGNLTNHFTYYIAPDGASASSGLVGRRDRPFGGASNLLYTIPNYSTIVFTSGKHTNGGTLSWENSANGNMILYQKTGLKLRGEPGQYFYNPTGATHILLRECHDIDISGLTFAGSLDQASFQGNDDPPPTYAVTNQMRVFKALGAIGIVHSDNIRVHDCTFSNLFAWGISGSHYNSAYPSSTNVEVDHNLFIDCGAWTDQTATYGAWGGGIVCSGGWDVHHNRAIRCGQGIRGEFMDNVNPFATKPYRIYDNYIRDHWNKGILLVGWTNGVELTHNWIERPTNDISRALCPTVNQANTGIHIYDGTGITLADNTVIGGTDGILIAPALRAASTNVLIRGGLIKKVRAFGVTLNSVVGYAVEGVQFIEIGAEAILGGANNVLLDGSITGNIGQGWDVLGNQNHWMSTKLCSLVSNLWVDNNHLVQMLPAESQIGFHLSMDTPASGLVTTNIYWGDNTIGGEATGGAASKALVATNGTIPIFMKMRNLICTNLWDPAAITAGAALITGWDSGVLSLAQSNDVVTLAPPVSWIPKMIGTNVAISCFASNRGVFVSIYNGGASTLDLPSDWVRFVITKPPAAYPYEKQQ